MDNNKLNLPFRPTLPSTKPVTMRRTRAKSVSTASFIRAHRNRSDGHESDGPQPKNRRKSDYFLSPNGLNSKSMKRLSSMRESRSEINSMISKSVLRVSRLDSDFEATFLRTECHSNAKVEENSKANWNIDTSKLDPSFIPYDYDPKEKSHNCPVCKRSFFHAHSLDAHMILHSKRDVAQFRCKVCTKPFKKKWKLRFHVAKKHICTGGTKVLLVI